MVMKEYLQFLKAINLFKIIYNIINKIFNYLDTTKLPF